MSATTISLAPDLRLVVGRLARKIRQAETGGMTPSQLSALSALEDLGSIRLGDLAAAEGVAAPTITRIVDNLEREGLVTRGPDPDDRRASRVALTPSGRAALRRIRGQRTAFLQERLDRIDPAEQAQLAALLPLLARLAEDPS
jgi:DNA-binding MarR family transcriptional regulator